MGCFSNGGGDDPGAVLRVTVRCPGVVRCPGPGEVTAHPSRSWAGANPSNRTAPICRPAATRPATSERVHARSRSPTFEATHRSRSSAEISGGNRSSTSRSLSPRNSPRAIPRHPNGETNPAPTTALTDHPTRQQPHTPSKSTATSRPFAGRSPISAVVPWRAEWAPEAEWNPLAMYRRQRLQNDPQRLPTR